MNLFSNPKCSNCNQPIPKDARFCPHCGAAAGGFERRCGVCGAVNRSDAVYCGRCGRLLAQSEAPEILRHRWSRSEEEFAVRIESDDLPGWLRNGVKVEPGTNAMLVEHGTNLGLLPPGEYTISTIGQRIKDWLTGDIPERTTILLVDISPVDLEFNLGGRFTRDTLPVGVTVRVMLEVTDPGKFLVNVLRGRERLTKEEIRQYLYPEVVQVVDRWLREHSLQELIDDLRQRALLELALDETLRDTLAQTGMRLIQVRTVELNLEPYDEIKGVRGKYALLNARELAELDGRRALAQTEAEKLKCDKEEQLLKAQIEADLQTRWLALDESNVAVYERIRQAAISNKMNEVRSETDFKKFLRENEIEQLLGEKEREELIRTWREQAEDQQRARAHLLLKVNTEEEYELRVLGLKLQREFDREKHAGDMETLAAADEKLDREIEIARKSADMEFELRRKSALEEYQLELERQRIEAERNRITLEIERLKRQQERQEDFEDAELGLKILARMKELQRLDDEERRRITREDDLIRLREQHQIVLEVKEADWRIEAERISLLSKLGTEALISLSSSEQGKIIGDLKRTETLKGMTEEQILAMAAERSPAVAEALKEKYRLIADGKASQVEREMYERLLGEQKEMLRQLSQESDKRSAEVTQAWEKASGRTQEIAEKALDRMAEFARGQSSSPVIVTPAAGPPVVYPRGGGGGALPVGVQSGTAEKNCPVCGRFVDAEEKFCRHCGHKFEGVA